MNEQKDCGVWARCGRCLGTGSVAVTSGHVVICPECGGKGSKKIGQVDRDRDLEKKTVPGRFIITLDQLPGQGFDLDDFKISVNLIPIHLPVSQTTGRAMALYEVLSQEITCRESKISVPMDRGYVCMGDISRLNQACPDHQHENEYTLQREILNPCDWDACDEATAETAYATSTVLPE